jgi:hypothetical protein
MGQYKTREEILSRVKEVQAIKNRKDAKEQGILETELDLLYIDLKDLEDPGWSQKNPWSKHPW